jgi:tetratricopeptide (TPR) repeat protein
LDHDFHSSAANLAFWLERQRYDRVVEEGRRLLASSPEDPQLHRLIAIAHLMLGERPSADHHLREALRLQADDQTSLSLLALMNASTLGSRASDRHALQALALDPDSLEAWHALASSSLADDTEFSKRCSRRMLEIDPSNIAPRLLLHCATSMDRDVPGWHAEAEQWLQEALTIEPENSTVHGLLGLHLIPVRPRRKEAQAHLRQAIALDPASSEVGSWRESLAASSDLGFKLLMLPWHICAGIISALGRSIARYPILLILGKFYLIAVVLCLLVVILWGIYLWPPVWLYRKYVIHGDHLRAVLSASGKRQLRLLVPGPAWLRRILFLPLMLGWWRLVPEGFHQLTRLHPDLHAGNVVAGALALGILGGIVMLCWLYFRKTRRRQEMASFPPSA